jgi:hypothetical protein
VNRLNSLEKLPQIANECLGGLRADESLRQRILQHRTVQKRRALPIRALALACSLIFVLGLGAAGLHSILNAASDVPLINTLTAGSLPEGTRTKALDVPRGSITLNASGSKPGYIGVWAASSGANFPLIRAEGRYYRLLQNPTEIDQSMLGQRLDSVSVYTDEPALDHSSAVISNAAAAGSAVHTLSGMDGTAVAAQVDGKLRVFQRVSFGGAALIGQESLRHTLSGQVTGLQLSDVGIVIEQNKVSELMNTLFSTAVYQGPATRATDQALLIQYANGIVLQMAVKGSSLIACGTWSAPDFIAAFEAAVE